jgi:uncharacterized repeat protein (TIGR03803 family)
LVQATDGDFYGTTNQGGAHNGGTVFRVTAAGTLTTIYTFCARTGCLDGFYPATGLIQATDGNFYGTTTSGGHAACDVGYTCGTIFKITPAGILTTLHAFDRIDGRGPSILIQATDGNFYGETASGGDGKACFMGCGTVFRITSAGTLTTLYNFDLTDGVGPGGGLVQATSGVFYGTTNHGGARCAEQGCGTVYALSLGLQPFVEALPPARKVGAPLKILGNYLAGASSVTFNGVPAEFQVISPSEIEATVPSGATTGPVQVVTPSGTLTSNVPFRVIQ